MPQNQNDRVSRRNFVATGTAAAAAISTVTQLGCNPFAKDKSKEGALAKGPTTRPAGSPLRIGFIGVGKMGWSHLTKFVGYKEFIVTAVNDVDTVRRENAKKHVDEKYVELERKGAQP